MTSVNSFADGTWEVGSCRSDISFLEKCSSFCRSALRYLDIVHPHVTITHKAPDGQKTLVFAKGFGPESKVELGVHITKLVSRRFANYVLLQGSALVDWIANKLGISHGSNLYWIVEHIIMSRTRIEPISSVVEDENDRHPEDVYNCKTNFTNFKSNNSIFQDILFRMNNSENTGYHLKDFNSQHWAYWVIHGEYIPTPYGIGL